MIKTYWHHTRTAAGRNLPAVKVSHRQVLAGNDSADPHLLVEEIVLESLDRLTVDDPGTTNEYPILRRRR